MHERPFEILCTNVYISILKISMIKCDRELIYLQRNSLYSRFLIDIMLGN